MSQDIQARESGMRAGVVLRPERFDEVTRIMGCTSEAARARLLGVDPKTIYRARHGILGEEFIAKVIDAMRANEPVLNAAGIDVDFEEVFEVGEKPAA
ncbi:hypothetical protein [Micromonospora carbonacea]|nr:hypothetical protein [Micromonospora carbonacea]